MYSTILIKFSIIRGGLFYRLQERLNLVHENDSRTVARAFIFALVTWLPLFILAALQNLALTGDSRQSLLLDFPVYGRFLIAVPLFIIAENVIDDRYVIITSYFLNSGIVPEAERSRYVDVLSSMRRLVFSPTAEIIILLAAYLVSTLSVSHKLIYAAATSWCETETGHLSLAGWWFLLVSLPLFHFLLIRWFWRLIVWCLFLRRLARLDLQLVSTHPDAVGGLGVLGESIFAFTPIAFALSALLSATWYRKVVYEGGTATQFHRPFLVFLFITILIAFAPLLNFTGRLMRLKLHGLHDYGVLANTHSLQFDEKWVRKGEKNIDQLLGTPDISSLADLGAGFQTVRNMKFFPFGLQNLLMLAAAAAIPMIPLVLVEIPLRELVLKLAGALF